MARTRDRDRGRGSDGTIASIEKGITEPPPFPVKEFNYKWRNWLNNLAQALGVYFSTLWFNLRNIDSADTPYAIPETAQVILADPDSSSLVLTLSTTPEDGQSHYIKNIDESGTYDLTIDPGTNNIDGQPGGAAPSTTDAGIAPLECYLLTYDSTTTTWWII